MKIIKELDQIERADLREKHQTTPAPSNHIKRVLNRPHCYKMDVYPEDYDKILIWSSIPGSSDSYNPISSVIEYIRASCNIQTDADLGGLCGDRVRWQLTKLGECKGNLQDCFITLGDCFMFDGDDPPYRSTEVTDGRHRLVAYGLATNMNLEHFPISIYYGTEKSPDQLKL